MRDSGILRFGFFTSPAVNVMLFHASAEKSDPTCTTARMTAQIDEYYRPAHADLNGMQRTPAGVLPELAEARPEIGSRCDCIATDGKRQHDERGER